MHDWFVLDMCHVLKYTVFCDTDFINLKKIINTLKTMQFLLQWISVQKGKMILGIHPFNSPNL